MQRVLLVCLTLFSLYASAAAQSLALPDPKPSPPAVKADSPTTLPGVASSSEPAIVAEKNPAPHIALLLPIKSATFGAAADAVKQGFSAAATLDKTTLPIRVYSDFDEDKNVAIAYRQAVANGAISVIGPLTRNGVLALTALRNFPVPTLSLNVADNTLIQNLYFFGLGVEMEAQQVARLARERGVKQAIIITSRAPLSKRLQSAFEDEWRNAGGKILREIEYNDDPSIFSEIADTPDTAIFLATDADKARLIRPYLIVRHALPEPAVAPPLSDDPPVSTPPPASTKLPIYATSRVFVGNDNTLANFDLSDIRFVDMPWLLQVDHPAVMTYPRANPPLSAENERLYALGIDAFRLIQLLLADNVVNALPVDGVTGQIQLRNHLFQRVATLAIFVQGHAQLNDAPIIRNADFPYAPVNTP